MNDDGDNDKYDDGDDNNSDDDKYGEESVSE